MCSRCKQLQKYFKKLLHLSQCCRWCGFDCTIVVICFLSEKKLQKNCLKSFELNVADDVNEVESNRNQNVNHHVFENIKL